MHLQFTPSLLIGINPANKTKNSTGVSPPRILLKTQRKKSVKPDDNDVDEDEEEDEYFSIGTALSSLNMENQLEGLSGGEVAGGRVVSEGDVLPTEPTSKGQLDNVTTTPQTTTTLCDALEGID